MKRELLRQLRLIGIALLLAAAVSTLLPPLPVFAINNPDSPTTIGNVEVYQDILETGDLGVLLDFETFYATLPTETCTEAFIVAFNDTDGTTHRKTIVPYSLLDKGYHKNIAWIYFTKAEVITWSIVYANMALYRVEVYGNPALTWNPGPAPQTYGTLDTWNTTGDAHVLIALDVITYGTSLEATWSLDMVQNTSVGNRLTGYGEDYFENVINNAKTVCPNAFYTNIAAPIRENPDYTTEFGATMSNGTGTCTGSPITLVSGANTVHLITTGTFTIVLLSGTVGTATSVIGGGTVTGTPVTIRAGTNTITATVGGTNNILVTVQLENTQTKLKATIIGTGLDLTTLATRFGVSREMFSGLIWLMVTVIICSAAYNRAGGKTILLIFDLCVIGGAVLGLMPLLAAALLFIGFGALTAYIFFFRNANA